MARSLVEKKRSKFIGLPKEEVYRKLGGFLGRKGFNYAIIKRSIDEIFEW